MNWDGLSVLVTGGTGSFGRKFVELLLRKHEPERVIVLSRDELKQHEMRQQLDHPAMRFFIGDVRDKDRLRRAFEGVDVVIHAAALKQVPACEYNPLEAVNTNVLGAANVIDAAIDTGVKKVMAISSDKAVNPVNLYGATKLCAEKLFVQSNAYSGFRGPRFSCCRYGNVAASRGSVVPKFLQQRQNGRLTVTDPRMTRFWLTLEEGVEFVMRCVGLMHGGEVFVPKIPSVQLMALVEAVAPGCEVEYVGIRSGEKLHEVLVSEDEAHHALELEDMYVIRPLHPWWKTENWAEAKPLVDGFRYSSDTNTRRLSVRELRELIPEA